MANSFPMGKTLFAEFPGAGIAFDTLLEPIVAAAMRGQYELLLAETERAVTRLFAKAPARVMLHVGGVWREWHALDAGVDQPCAALPADLREWDNPGRIDAARWFIPIVTGALGVMLTARATIALPVDLKVLRQCVSLALQTCERQRIAAQNLDEVQTLQRVATRMLKAHDLGEILLHITQEAKRLLSADICGVLLKEADHIVMRRCVGNHSPETAMLRMRPGQGLAGRAFERREPSAVEDYVSNAEISRDFIHLAETEMVRSALAVPLLGRETVIGVLEVWRRRPSTFTPLDHVRLVALANLALIAIENAELYAKQQSMLEELGRANEALNQRYDTVRSLSTLTQNLMQMLLQGGGLSAIVASASSFLQAEVAILDAGGQVIAWDAAGNPANTLPDFVRKLSLRAVGPSAQGVECLDIVLADGQWKAHALRVESDTAGWVLGRVGTRGADTTALTIAQVAMIAAMHRLEQRAASRARSETIDAIVWDLLQSNESARAAAIDRAADIKLDLDGPLRLFVCELGPAVGSIPEHSISAVRLQIARVIAGIRPTGVRAIAIHGLSLAILCDDVPLDDVERFAQRMAQRLAADMNDRLVRVGGSSSCIHAHALSTAYREAQIALDVARQLHRTGAVVYDRAGVVGMLLGLRHEAGMQRFLELNFGQLLHEDDKQREQFMQTLRVFFDVNCSHEAAAQRLGVHRKTISYRLSRISELTGLDFSTHDDRLVADLSLYVYRLIAAQHPIR
jgi:sugar diacid utilization regulator/putative methionine-R-sulfoxide reductase with GAF domain